jgi:diphthine-ammonia ligase
VVATRLDEDMLGKPINKTLVRQISKLGSHPCGENGEYHTFVTGGPIFRKALKVTSGESKKIDKIWFREISAELQ